MSSERPEGVWRRLLVESVVIVLSILAALTINTWWSGIQEHRRARAEVASLQAEFAAVDIELTRASAEVQLALASTRRLAQLAGPHAQPIATDTFGTILTRALTINVIALPTGALANLLSSGDLSILDDIPLQNDLASWPSISSLMSVKFASLVTDRGNILSAMNEELAVSPVLARTWPTLWEDDNTFDADAKPLLTSRKFESLLAERWIGILIAVGTIDDAQKLSKSINAQLKAWH